MHNLSIGPVIRDDLFERLNIPDAEQYRTRVDLAYRLVQAVRGVDRDRAAERLGIEPSELTKLLSARIDGVSQARLEELLQRLN